MVWDSSALTEISKRMLRYPQSFSFFYYKAAVLANFWALLEVSIESSPGIFPKVSKEKHRLASSINCGSTASLYMF